MKKFTYEDKTRDKVPTIIAQVTEDNAKVTSGIATKYKIHPKLDSNVSVIEVQTPNTNLEYVKFLLLKLQSVCRSEFAGTSIYLLNNSETVKEIAQMLSLEFKGEYFDITKIDPTKLM